MDSSIYIAVSRQLAQFRDVEITANNIANASTPGYNAQKLVFTQYMVDNGEFSKKDAYADAPYGYRDTSTGAMQITNNPLDLAIKGNGYFQVETPLGVRYTKSGNFQIDSQGMMITADGYPVLGADGSTILLPQNAKNIEITALGQIKVDGQASGQVGMVEFANEQAMVKVGNSFYTSKETPQAADSARMIQGAIENSNVNGVTELVRMMQLTRSFSSTSKFIEAVYDLERKTSSTFTKANA